LRGGEKREKRGDLFSLYVFLREGRGEKAAPARSSRFWSGRGRGGKGALLFTRKEGTNGELRASLEKGRRECLSIPMRRGETGRWELSFRH